jgi:CRP/FNR family transcriptional regulator, anaerobic regulatory protein
VFHQLAATSADSGNSESPEGHCRREEHPDPDRGLRKLWQSSSVRLFKAGQHVFPAGDVQLHLYKVASGTIRLYKNLKDGRRQVIGFLFAGDLIGLELQPQHVCSAQAIGSASVQSVPVAIVYALALEDVGVLFELYASLSNEIVAAQDLALSIGRADPEERLGRFLVVLSRRNRQHGRDPAAIDLSMPRADIADHLGLTIETVSRTLTRLVKRRLIKLARRRSIQILDMNALEALMDGLRRTGRRGRNRR